MTKSVNKTDLTQEEVDIFDHARSVGLHVKKASPHSGHCWYCFDCCHTQDQDCHYHNHQQKKHGETNVVPRHAFDSNAAIKHHLTAAHGVHWSSSYWEPEDAV